MMTQEALRIGAFVSGGGTNLQAVLDACKNGLIPGRVVVVGSDVPGAGGLDRAKAAGVPTFVVDYKAEEKKLRQDAELFSKQLKVSGNVIVNDIFYGKVAAGSLGYAKAFTSWDKLQRRIFCESLLLDALNQHPFDLLVLAGFMRVLSPFFIDAVNIDPERPRIMNIHPALLPAFPGTDGYADTFNYGCKVGGCTVHFVDYGEDTGPIIGQRAITINPGESLDDFKKRGLKEEWKLFPECVRLFAEGRLRVVQGVGGRKVVEII